MHTEDNTTRDLIALGLVPGAGRKTVYQALSFLQRAARSLRECHALPAAQLHALGAQGEEKALEAIRNCGEDQHAEAESILRLCKKAGIRYWTCLHPDYPAYLEDTLGDQAPPILFYQGNEALLHERGMAVVGTRRPTDTGIEWTRKTAQCLAEDGITVVSGGAAGVDLEAHATALRADGATVVVLPEGIHGYHPPPPIQRGLRNGQLLLLSEFLPSCDWQTHRAMTRNRTIAACARAVCVVEPGARGGSLYTAEQGLAQNKTVLYWGGASGAEALRGKKNAYPLVRDHQLDRRRLHAAGAAPQAQTPAQGELFAE